MRTLTPLYHHIDKEVSPLFSFNLLIIPSSTIQYNLVIALATTTALLMIFRLRHNPSGLIIVSHRNRFVILRTDNSLPITPHPALRQRSYFQLQSLWFTLVRTYTLLVECLRGRTRVGFPSPPMNEWKQGKIERSQRIVGILFWNLDVEILYIFCYNQLKDGREGE